MGGFDQGEYKTMTVFPRNSLMRLGVFVLGAMSEDSDGEDECRG